MSSENKYGSLGVLIGKRFKRLPRWSEYLVEVGKYVSRFSITDQSLTVGIILPTRAYAASFLATGSTIAKTLSQKTETASYTSHLKLIQSLKPGSPVTLISTNGSRAQKGEFKEIRVRDGSPSQIVIITSRGNSRAGGVSNLIRPEQCLRIKIDSEEGKQLPVNEKLYDLSLDRSFISNLIGNDNVDSFQFNSTNDTLIVGKEKELRAELLHPSFISKFMGEISNASELQEIVRVRRFASSGNFSSRTRFLHDSGKRRKLDLGAPTDGTERPTGIFDGGRAFLKWGRSITGINSVIVLPRNDRNFSQTVHQINERYYLREDDITEVKLPVDTPPGTETVFFTEPK